MDLQGLYYIGTLSKGLTLNYTKKDGSTGTNYSALFEFLGGKHSLGLNEELYQKLEEGKTYALPTAIYTNRNMDFANMFVRTRENDPIYEVVDGEFIQIN